MAIHFSILAQKILWTEEPGGVQSTGSQRVGHNRACTHSENGDQVVGKEHQDLIPILHPHLYPVII